jgi:hypothetical protein
MRGGYSGACLRVRRSSDDAEQDIGFSGGLLDTTALLAFVGSGNDGFVRTWHDQGTAGGWNMQQETKAEQFRVVDDGNLVTRNSIVAVHNYATSTKMVASASGGNAGSHFISGAMSFTSSSENFGRLVTLWQSGQDQQGLNQWAALFRQSTSNIATENNANVLTLSAGFDDMFIAQCRAGQDILGLRKDGGSESTNTSSRALNLTYESVNLGFRPTSSNASVGHFQEIALYTSDPGGTIRDFVRDNQNDYFDVY